MAATNVSTLAYDFAAYLESNGFGTLGVSIYYLGFPSTPDALTAIIPQGGPFWRADDPVDNFSIQILTRDPDVRTGLGIVCRMFELIQGRFIELPHSVLRFEANAPPGAYYRDEQNRAVFSMNYLTTGMPSGG